MELQTRLGSMTGDVQKDVKTLINFIFQQSEDLRYLLHNLDVTNFNDLGLMRYENGRMQIYTEKLDIKAKELTAEFEEADEKLKTTIETDVNGLRTTVSGLNGRVSTVEQTANGMKTTVSSHTSSINNINHTKIPGLQSQITQNANSISLVVKNGDVSGASIVTAINAMGEGEVQINANRVNISGLVTINDLSGNGTVEINAGNIAAGGTISGVSFYSEYTDKFGDSFVVEIWKGQISFNNGTISDNNEGDLNIIGNNGIQLYADSGYVKAYSGGVTWWLTEDGWERM